MFKIEFYCHHYGNCILSIEYGETLNIGQMEIPKALEAASEKLFIRYSEGDSVFKVSKKQLEIIKSFCKIVGK